VRGAVPSEVQTFVHSQGASTKAPIYPPALQGAWGRSAEEASRGYFWPVRTGAKRSYAGFCMRTSENIHSTQLGE
jgi:hypothetical protein